MRMTISQKILASKADLPAVKSGDIVWIKLDLILGNDISGSIAIKELNKIGMPPIKAAEKIALVPDHFTPNKDIETAENCKLVRNFARRVGVKSYFEVGRVGIEHALLPEAGLVVPGIMMVGGDSHTTTHGAFGAFATGIGPTDLAAAMVLGETWLRVPETIRITYSGNLKEWVGGKDLILYTIGKIGTDGALGKTMEFCGPTISTLDIDNRMTMANMAVEAGAVNGIMEPDSVVESYLEDRSPNKGLYLSSDPDATYEERLEIDVSSIEPQVSYPFSPGNALPVQELAGKKLDQVYIGSCTNGRISDLRAAARILKGKKCHSRVRLLINPATPTIYKEAISEGLLEIFLDAGAVLIPPSCGVCFGGHMGVLAEGEACLSTTPRNYKARLGHPKSQVYLSSPAVAAASAIRGEITHPLAIDLSE